MKENILKLRSEGKSYNEIKKELGCSKSTIAYHCGDGQKIKNRDRARRHRKKPLVAKLETFKAKSFKNKIRDFQRREGSTLSSDQKEFNFTVEDVIRKMGKQPMCYLSGEVINIEDFKSFHFDHIKPASKGGLNTLKNLGILSASVNKMKHDLTVEEFIDKCVQILTHLGYTVIKK